MTDRENASDDVPSWLLVILIIIAAGFCLWSLVTYRGGERPMKEGEQL